MNNYYPRLRDLREDRDMTQEQIAAYLGMKQAQYSRYERGLRDIPTDVLIRLALFYNTSTDYILGLTDDSRPVSEMNLAIWYAGEPTRQVDVRDLTENKKSRLWCMPQSAVCFR